MYTKQHTAENKNNKTYRKYFPPGFFISKSLNITEKKESYKALEDEYSPV